MQATKFQQQLVRVMARVYAGLYMETAGKAITKSDLEKIAYGWNTVVASALPTEGIVRTFYFISGTEKLGNAYDIFIWVNTEDGGFRFEKIGQVAYDMKDHLTVEQFEELLLEYRDVADPVPVLASKYVDDIGFVEANFGELKITVKADSYSLVDPLKAKLNELDGFYKKVEMLSALDFNNCVDITIAVVNSALD